MLPLKYSVSEDDFVAAAELALQTRSRFQSAQRWYLPGMGIVIIAGSLVSRPWVTHSWGGMGAAMLIGLFLIRAGLAWKGTIRNQYRKVPTMGGPRTLEANDQGLHFISAVMDGRASWEVYERFAEDARTFILMQRGSRIFIPIPKRELAPDQIEGLRELFQSHLPGR
jgi:hypothetical protein